MHFLEPYDPDWPERASVEADLWAAHLGQALIACHHIGSTSVPDLTAKPVIDLLVEVSSHTHLKAAAPRLVAQGYEDMGPFGLPGRLYFRKSASDGTRLVQVHAYETGDPSLARHLAFRDLLRSDQTVRAGYADIKRRADAASDGDINRYMDLKDPWIAKHEAIALRRYDH